MLTFTYPHSVLTLILIEVNHTQKKLLLVLLVNNFFIIAVVFSYLQVFIYFWGEICWALSNSIPWFY